MRIITIILIISLIDLTLALSCREVSIKECLDYCSCFKCIFHDDNVTMEECHSQGGDAYDICESHHEIIKPNERTCSGLPLAIELIVIISVFALMGMLFLGGRFCQVLKRKYNCYCTCVPPDSDP